MVCNKDHRFIVTEQLGATVIWNAKRMLMEPFGRNTAPAVAITAMMLVNEGRDELMLVLPADHVIEDQKALQRALALATVAAERGEMVLFGVSRRPSRKPVTATSSPLRCAVARRRQPRFSSSSKNPMSNAPPEFVQAGGYYWNSGMFLFRASRYLEELKKHDPDIYDNCLLTLERSKQEGDTVTLDEASFACCPDNSIDYAVMEKTQRACVVPLDAGWSDVGCWSSLWDVHAKDENGNVAKGDVVIQDSRNCMIQGNGKLVTVIGLDNIVVVETKDAMMIVHKDKVQGVKQLVNTLNEQGRSETQNHSKSIALGVLTTPWTWAAVSRSSAFPSSRAPAFRCRCTTTALSTGSLYRVPLRSPATTTCSC